MINAFIDINKNKLIIETDDPSVKCLLEFKRKVNKYVPWFKQWREVEELEKLYEEKRVKPDKNGIYTFTLGRGWTAYIANVFKDMMSADVYIGLLRSIYSDSYREYPFPGLRDYQNQDVLHILKYRLGLVTVNTGYGKYIKLPD